MVIGLWIVLQLLSGIGSIAETMDTGWRISADLSPGLG